MKYHKIKGVEKSVCTAEQKIAANIAFRINISFGDQYKEAATAIIKDEILKKAVRVMLNAWRRDYPGPAAKYDNDAIFCALNAGIKEYMDHFQIFANYESIGRAFPALYME